MPLPIAFIAVITIAGMVGTIFATVLLAKVAVDVWRPEFATPQPGQPGKPAPVPNGGGNPLVINPISGKVDSPLLTQVLSDGASNPWWWVGLAIAGFAGAIVIKQFRGAARDVGSGVSTTYNEAKSSTDNLGSDPGGSRRK